MKYFEVDQHAKVFVFTDHVYMGKSFDGLRAHVRDALKKNPENGSLFLFYNRKRDYVKILFYRDGGYCIFAKRLEAGKFALGDGVTKFTLAELQGFLAGSSSAVAKKAA